MRVSEWKVTDIRRKNVVDDDYRTPERDLAADFIQHEILEKDRWPMDIIEIAAESEWSRPHITNTLKYYFEPTDKDNVVSGPKPDSSALDRELLDLILEVQRNAYRQGYQDGKAEQQLQISNEQSVEERLQEMF